ncbi:hypothetical protein BW1_087_00140 [Bacillus mycoides NBRC 101238 = DSM 11821]|nr:hypothetical protein BW1_087_00140 [Bacillus mycoides NBRC 101238 = DSM 11821]
MGLGKAQGLFLPCLAWLGKAEKRRRPLWILIQSVKIRIGLRQLTQFRRLARLIVSINLGEVVALYVVLYLI